LNQGLKQWFDRLRQGEVVFFPDTWYYFYEKKKNQPNKIIWLKTCGFPLLDADDKAQLFMIMHENINDRIELAETRKIINEKMEEARENERQEISVEMHDELGQIISGIISKAETFKEQLHNTDDLEKCTEISNLLGTIRNSIQKIIFNVWPEIIDHLGIAKAIEALTDVFTKNSHIPVRLLIDYSIQLPRDEARQVYRIAQESLTNISKHTMATQATLKFLKTTTGIILQITDNGAGMKTQAAAEPKTLGHWGMNNRAKKLNASLIISNIKPQGTQISLSIPL
jgi:signal transduction histidine kinase